MLSSSIDNSAPAGALAVDRAWYQSFVRNLPRSTTIDRAASNTDPTQLEIDLRHAFHDDVKGQDDPTASITVDRGVALVPVHGMITQRGRFWWMRAFSCENAAIVIRHLAEHRSDVHTIALDIDSGGGSVAGTDRFAETIYNLRDTIPIIGVINEFAASGAYWIASACKDIRIGRTGTAGSIGVYTMHTDWSRYEKELGVDTEVIYAGRYKAAHERKLNDELREFMQDQIDEYYRLFVDTVARNRNRTSEYVLSDMADARIFIGQQAVDAGLADSIGTLDEVVEEYATSSTSTISEQFNVSGTRLSGNRRYARRVVKR